MEMERSPGSIRSVYRSSEWVLQLWKPGRGVGSRAAPVALRRSRSPPVNGKLWSRVERRDKNKWTPRLPRAVPSLPKELVRARASVLVPLPVSPAELAIPVEVEILSLFTAILPVRTTAAWRSTRGDTVHLTARRIDTSIEMCRNWMKRCRFGV